jgi:hypothetical protein
MIENSTTYCETERIVLFQKIIPEKTNQPLQPLKPQRTQNSQKKNCPQISLIIADEF